LREEPKSIAFLLWQWVKQASVLVSGPLLNVVINLLLILHSMVVPVKVHFRNGARDGIELVV